MKSRFSRWKRSPNRCLLRAVLQLMLHSIKFNSKIELTNKNRLRAKTTIKDIQLNFNPLNSLSPILLIMLLSSSLQLLHNYFPLIETLA